jgi:hypothetical protein
MANKRMFSLKVVDTDAFLDMPQSSQLLYYSLAMRADDDGFVSNPKKIMRMIGSQDDDYKVLIAKKFVIQFESGVCVIKHWLIHNLIRSDRYSETHYIREKAQLKIDGSTKKYSLDTTDINVIPNGNQMAPQVRLGKVRIDKEIHCAFNSKNFEEVWSVYPNKANKKKAVEKWNRLSEDIQTKIINNVKERVINDSQWQRGYVPHLTTYLNNERWEDEYEKSEITNEIIKVK